MTNQEIQDLLDMAVTELHGTTVGYHGRTPEWYANTTTRWYKGLRLIADAQAALEPAAPPPPPPPPANRVQLQGSTLAAMVGSARPGVPAFVPQGSYTTSSMVGIPAGSDIEFRSVTILPSNPGQSSLQIRGNGTRLRFTGACRFGAPGARNARNNNGSACAFELTGTDDTVIHADDLTVEGVAGNTMLLWNRNNRLTVSGTIRSLFTGSDSFHCTNGGGGAATNIDFQAKLYSEGSGDDCFAVVSYAGGPSCDNVRWRDVMERGQKWGRGISVVGGKNVTVDKADLDGTAGAGIYIAAEPEYNTLGVSGVTIVAAKIRNPNTRGIHDANVIVYSNQATALIENVAITVDPDPAFAVALRKGSGAVRGVVVNGKTI